MPVLVGDYTGLDRIEWVVVALTKDFPGMSGTSWAEAYRYVAYYEDVFDDEFGNLCIFNFFNFGTPTRVSGRSAEAVLFDDGSCGHIGGWQPNITGFRIQGPQ